MMLVITILFFIYALCMAALFFGTTNIPIFLAGKNKPVTGFSIIIPFRNEAENLPNLLKSIEKLQYPNNLFEIIFVDDASEDASVAIIKTTLIESEVSLKLINNNPFSNSPKKDAISEAIKNSSFEWVATTDADCQLPPKWLKTFDAIIQKNKPVMVAAPVIYESNGSFLENFQQLDGFSLQAITVAGFGFKSPLLCNGANLAYRKKSFFEVNGFSGNNHIASGDDIFLLEKMKKQFPGKTVYLKSQDAIVPTKPQTSLKNIINQRVRWASKTSQQKNKISVLLGIFVFIVNVAFLALPILVAFQIENFIWCLLLIYFKVVIDFIVVLQTALFFAKKPSFFKFQLQLFVYAIIICTVFIKSFNGKYVWKGRDFQQREKLI